MDEKKFIVSPGTMRSIMDESASHMRYQSAADRSPVTGMTRFELFDLEVVVDPKMPDRVVALVDASSALKAVIHSGSITLSAIEKGLHEYEVRKADGFDPTAGTIPDTLSDFPPSDPDPILVGNQEVGPFYEDMWKIPMAEIKEVAEKHRPVGFVGSIQEKQDDFFSNVMVASLFESKLWS